eukprot:3620698-Alexandrium_andersonii.AAC.1
MGSHRIELACETALNASRVCPPGFLSGWRRLERALTALAIPPGMRRGSARGLRRALHWSVVPQGALGAAAP